ncbi:MAG: hypothetical protein ACO3EY_05420 [Candidatus Nanopelagicales bacterium]
MKKIAICLLFFSCSCNAFDVKFSGQTNYTQQKSKSLITTLNAEYKFKLYEPSHKGWELNLNGKVNPDYDHFGKEFKTNVFTTLGIDF